MDFQVFGYNCLFTSQPKLPVGIPAGMQNPFTEHLNAAINIVTLFSFVSIDCISNRCRKLGGNFLIRIKDKYPFMLRLLNSAFHLFAVTGVLKLKDLRCEGTRDFYRSVGAERVNQNNFISP